MTAAVGLGKECPITDDDFKIIAEIAFRESAIRLPEGKIQLVYSRLVKRVRHLKLSSFRDYCDVIQRDDAEEERMHLISALTTNVTRFQREPHHFRHLRERVLPSLVKRAIRGDRVRLWSSACATGEEAYEIALEVLELCPGAAQFDLKILATDIDPGALAKAKAGRYVPAALNAFPKEKRNKYFAPAEDLPGMMEVSAAARDLVTFRPINLARPWPVTGLFDVIFCRNVAIYFDTPTQERLWQGFADVLALGGSLYIGHSERLSNLVAAQFAADGVTTYRRVSLNSQSPVPTAT